MLEEITKSLCRSVRTELPINANIVSTKQCSNGKRTRAGGILASSQPAKSISGCCEFVLQCLPPCSKMKLKQFPNLQ